MQKEVIRYDHIAKAQTFYSALGYQNIETPWLVSSAAIMSTLPALCRSFDTWAGSVVGSGEQGFIQMMIDGTLPKGKYQTITPCFRDEQVLDNLSRQSFLKLELISYMPDDHIVDFDTVLDNAMCCMFELTDIELLHAEQTKEGVDVLCNGIEVGSYGVRKMNDHIWVYGTGLAEPRFSIAVKSAGIDLTVRESASSQMDLPFA